MMHSATGDDIFAEILMHRTIDTRTILVVEGTTDAAALDPLIDPQHCFSLAANGKLAVLRVVECTKRRPVVRVLAVVDNDMEFPIEWPSRVHPDNLVWTERNDLDAEVFYSGGVLERLCSNYCSSSISRVTSLASIKREIETLALPLSVFAQVARRESFAIAVAAVPLHGVVDDSGTIGVARMLSVARTKTPGLVTACDAVEALLERELAAGGHAINSINGHRLFEAFALLINRSWGSGCAKIRAKELERSARAAFSPSDLQSTELFRRVGSWCDRAGARVWRP